MPQSSNKDASSSSSATLRPSMLLPRPSAEMLRAEYTGLPLTALPTPAVVIDRARVAQNCAAMLAAAETHWQCKFRAHIKTHKTREATAAQVGLSNDHAIIVSTLAEAWGVVESGLVASGAVMDILYGVPLGVHKVAALLALRKAAHDVNRSSDVKVIVDHPDQIVALQDALEKDGLAPLHVFIKIDCGYQRAGLAPTSPVLPRLVAQIAASTHVHLWGVYTHAGFSYDARTLSSAVSHLSGELQSCNEAAVLVADVMRKSSAQARMRAPLVISVGSTPTAHAAVSMLQPEDIAKIKGELQGELELHAGNYPFLDLQQLGTSAIPDLHKPMVDHCSLTVLTTVSSVYPERASKAGVAQILDERPEPAYSLPGDEAMCDAGSIAVSKDTGPIKGFGHVVWPAQFTGWHLARIAQEHGVLALGDGEPLRRTQEGKNAGTTATPKPAMLAVGDKVRLIPQHACMVAAAHPWFYIIDSALDGEDNLTVQDVWVPWKGW